jgi:DNA-binding NtrC family response regulator
MAGEEVLIASAIASDRKALSALVERHGLVVSQVESAELGRERVAGKFFAVLIADLDLAGGSAALLEFARERSPATQMVAVTSRKNFDGAVAAFRAGSIDVVAMRPDEMPRLDRAIELALDRYRATDAHGLQAVIDTLDELTKLMVALGRQVYQHEIDSLTVASTVVLNVLFVDDDTAMLQEASDLIAEMPIVGHAEISGGGALDKIGAMRFEIAVVKENLPDLPGSIVVSAAQQRAQECVALVYQGQGTRGGRIDRVVEGHVVETYKPFNTAAELIAQVSAVVEQETARRKERKVLQVIRNKHGDLLRRYVDAKRRLEAMKSRGG